MTRDQADEIKGVLEAAYPGSQVAVAPDPDGALIYITDAHKIEYKFSVRETNSPLLGFLLAGTWMPL